jgi:hypothetical protein
LNWQPETFEKLFFKTMETTEMAGESMMEILAWYERANALSMEEKKMVYIDTLFPHSFFGTVKNQFIKTSRSKGRA